MPNQQRASSSGTRPAAVGESQPARAAAADDPAGGAAAAPSDVAAAAPSEEFPDIASLGYEDARDELISIVGRLEGGQIGLEDSMRLWHRGEALAAHCRRWLDGAEATLAATDVTGLDGTAAKVASDGTSTDG